MNKLEARRQAATDLRINFHQIKNWRAEKRYMKKAIPMVEEAYHMGCMDGDYGVYENPFPKGRRHNEYHRGWHEADPMGDWHGNNA